MKIQTSLTVLCVLFSLFTAHAQNVLNLNKNDYNKSSIVTNENLSESNFFYKYNQSRPFTLNPAVHGLQKSQIGSTIQLDLFPATNFTAAVEKVKTDVNQTKIITASIDNYDASYAIISIAKDGKYSVTIEITEQSKSFATRVNPKTGKIYLVNIDRAKEDVLTCDEVPTAAEDEQPSNKNHNIDGLTNPQKMATAELDLLVLYTSAAENWANNNQGGMNNYLATLVSSSQTALDNSEIDANLNLVHSALTSYNESGDSGQDLTRLRTQGDGFMDEAHTLRDTHYADLVMLISLTNDTGGIAYLLNNQNGSPSFGFSLVRVQQPVSSYTFIHEIGHNMGCGHNAEQNFQAGPGLFSYSAGGRWTSTNGGKYCSIMSYESGTYYADGVTHNRVPHFSNPNVNYIGAPTGDPTTADNARNNEFTKLVIEDYRIAPGGSPTLSYQSNTIDDDTNGASNGNDNGIPEGGESIQLSVELDNTGTADATNVSATLATTDADITITDADLDWNDIAQGNSSTASDFTFDIASGTIAKDVTFTLDISSDEGTWSDTFTISIFEEPGETVLAYQSNTIDDDTNGASNGNDNGIPEGGESIQLSVELQNTGTADATNVSATLATTDVDITITDADLDWNDIAQGNSSTASDFTFDIASGTIAKDVTFTLDISSDEGTWSDTFTISIFEEPGETVLAYQSNTIDDDTNGASNGNDNGIPEGGESIQLSVELQNTGTADATNVSAILSTTDADITITDADLDWNDIAQGNSSTASDFTFDIASGTIAKDVTFTLNISSDEGTWSDDFIITIGSAPAMTSIPDANFEQALIDLSLDNEMDGAVLTSNISSVTSINLEGSSIADLTGIQDFAALQTLNINNNDLSEVNLEQNLNLTSLQCNGNMLSAIGLSENILLETLTCSNNVLTEINLNANTALEVLDLSGNQVMLVDLNLNNALINVNISDNPIDTLTLSSSIEVLNCSDAGLSTIPVTQLSALTTLICTNNEITSLDMSNNVNLVNLNARSNSLNSLDLRNGNHANFEVINVGDNPDLRCIYVNDPENVGGDILIDGTDAVFVEDENACEALSVLDIAISKVTLFPNPTEGIVNIGRAAAVEISTVTVYDALGRNIKSSDNTEQVDLRGLESGLYSIIIKDTQHNSANFRIIKR